MLNFHPGSHVRQGVEIGVRYIADMLDAVMAEGTATPILLETMAGKGSEVGRSLRNCAKSWTPRATEIGSACVWIPAMCTTRL